MKIRNFRDLNIWKLGMEFAVDVYKITKIFPKEEVYGPVSKIRFRSADRP